MIVVSNKSKILGSASCDDIKTIRKVAKDLLHTDQVYVIPSSVHEMLIYPVVGTIEEMNQIIRDINDTKVDKKIQLGDHAYFFDFSK